MPDHTVKQGEHTTRIAHRYGFLNFLTIWDHAPNAELKKRRKNPNVLFPGDTLVVPDKEAKKVPGATGRLHRYQIAMKQLMLRIRILSYARKPIADTKCELEVEGKTAPLVTDRNGQIEQLILPTTEIAKLSALEDDYSVLIGHLDPVQEQPGLEARLNNLGYYVPPPNDRGEDELRSAIEEFQRDHNLLGAGGRPSGVADDATRAKLLEVHGC